MNEAVAAMLAAAMHKAEVDCWPSVDDCHGAGDHRRVAVRVVAYLDADALLAALTDPAATFSDAMRRLGVNEQDIQHGVDYIRAGATLGTDVETPDLPRPPHYHSGPRGREVHAHFVTDQWHRHDDEGLGPME